MECHGCEREVRSSDLRWTEAGNLCPECMDRQYPVGVPRCAGCGARLLRDEVDHGDLMCMDCFLAEQQKTNENAGSGSS